MKQLTAVGLIAVVATMCGIALFAVGVASAAKPSDALFSQSTPGTYSWTVPKGVRQVRFDVFGASGGNGYTGDCTIYGNTFTLSGSVGGKGGEATATYSVTPGQVFEIVVGGQGHAGLCNASAAGGSNGGADGGNIGGGGGGASDVRGGSCVATVSCDLYARFLVGGGGGGADANAGSYDDDGGAGGGLTGGAGNGNAGSVGYGGTQTQGGSGYFSNGTFGAGGGGIAGGGGGWYGGGGSNDSVPNGAQSSIENGGGGGGSGYISPIAVSGSFQSGVRTGNGMVMITKA
jgi:Glycine rich protein